jgi:hypothetical protein
LDKWEIVPRNCKMAHLRIGSLYVHKLRVYHILIKCLLNPLFILQFIYHIF